MGDNLPDDNNTTPQKKSLLTNPTLMGWLTVIGLPLGLYSLYLTFAFNKEVKPVYKVLSDVVITESQVSSKIKVYYDKTEVPNVRAATITFWNAGNEYLDKTAFSKDKPLSIRSRVPVQILEANLLVSTRPDLRFKVDYTLFMYKSMLAEDSARLDKSKMDDFFGLQIEGDEGLEAKDGATFLILYTSKTKGDWYVDARIKGVPAGIQQAVEPNEKAGSFNFFLLFLSLSYTYMCINYARSKEYSLWAKIGFALMSIVLIAASLNQIRLGYQEFTALTPPSILVK